MDFVYKRVRLGHGNLRTTLTPSATVDSIMTKPRSVTPLYSGLQTVWILVYAVLLTERSEFFFVEFRAIIRSDYHHFG